MNKEIRQICLIDIKDIPDEGLSVRYDDVPGLLSDIEEISHYGPLHARAFLQKLDGYVHVKGDIDVTLHLICHRCLEEYPFAVHSTFSYVLSPSKDFQEKERELEEKDMEISSFDGIHIPLGEIFREQVLLQIPLRNLCSEECKGLCSICGANLNKEPCKCKEKTLRSKFAALEALKKSSINKT